MSIPGSGSPLLLATTAAAAAAEYVIPKSLRFNSGDNAHLDKTFASEGNRRTWTWSGWLKRSKFDQYSYFFTARSASTNYFVFNFTDDSLKWYNRPSSGTHRYATTDAVFRDVAAWYHVVLAWDTTESTDSDRVKLYVNGERITSFSASVWPAQNEEGVVNDNHHHEIGAYDSGTQYQYNGLMADVQFVDGQALAPTDFGETRSSDGVWVPKEASFTSPNDGTTWSSSTSGGAVAGSYPMSQSFDGSTSTAGVRAVSGGGFVFGGSLGISYSSSVRVHSGTSGIGTQQFKLNDGTATDMAENTFVTVATGAGTLNKLEITAGSTGNANIYLGAVEVDGVILQDGLGRYGKNGFHLNFSDSSTNEALGFDSAPTAPDPDPKKGFDVVTYTGNGGTQNIGGLNFEPGLVWTKIRNASGYANKLVDSVRGATKSLVSNNSNAELTEANGVKTFNPDGFTLGSQEAYNKSNNTFVAWTWRAGGPAVANTDGSITSQVSANTDYGFSIVSYTGTGSSATIGHGLGATPALVILKNRGTGSTNWQVFGNGFERLELNGSGAEKTDGYTLARTSTTISPTGNSVTNNQFNASGNDYIAYCWSEVSGYSKFSSYSGTGSSGNAVTTGFKPRFVLIKHVDGAHGWYLYDSERSNGNAILEPNSNGAEYSGGNSVVFNDNGFTVDATSADLNSSGNTYIYAAFADRPGNDWDVNNIVTNEGLTTSKTQFDVVTYTGNGSSQSIDSLAFQPDLVWLKARSVAYSHQLYDSIRGVQEALVSNTTAAEATYSGGLTAFNSNGFTIGNDGGINNNNSTFVAWCWKANGTAVSNTDGSITSSVSANAAYGFSIVTFTTSTAAFSVGHGLSTTPKLVIHKDRDNAYIWTVYHADLGPDKYLTLNSTAAATTSSGQFGTGPTDSVVNFSSGYANNNDGVCYCFADVPGYQRIGSYTGNGSNTGPVIVTGFKPRFLLIKSTTESTRNWVIFDSERDPSNPNDLRLSPNSNSAELTQGSVDFLADGFQLKNGTGPGAEEINKSSQTYIYLAIGDDEIGSDEDCLVDVPNAVTADADATDTTGGYQRGNYATLNPLQKGSNVTLSNGNLDYTASTETHANKLAFSTIGVSSGKWYAEATCTAKNDQFYVGVMGNVTENFVSPYTTSLGFYATGWGYYSGGQIYNNGSIIDSAPASVETGDVVGVALDVDNRTVTFYKNGVQQGSTATSLTADATWMFAVASYISSSISYNFGQMRFKYPMPSGYAALNTTALPAATIEDGSAYFNTALWTGDGGSSVSVTTGTFEPDFIWIKQRNKTYYHQLYDAVRGYGSGKALASNESVVEGYGSPAQYGYVSATSSTGFTGTAGSGTPLYVNENNTTYVAWVWDAGSSTVSNTDGTITTSQRVNQSVGFSISTYTGNGTAGATFGHGLNAVPDVIIIKARDSVTDGSWIVGHSAMGLGYARLLLNSTAANNGTPGNVVANDLWNNTAATSSVVSIGSYNAVNDSGDDYVAYCFTAVAGYSAFGSYEGNGSSDGPFVYTGFRPALVIIKRYDSAEQWYLNDTARDTFNVTGKSLRAQSTGAEASTGGSNSATWDILSNGFKLQDSGVGSNASGGDYIYMAWAENPFQANGGLAR